MSKGTTVRLIFPALAAAAAPTPTPAASVAPSPVRILLVDDDPVLLKTLRDILESDGHTIVTASGGKEGIDTFRTGHANGNFFAIVITDLGMPYIDGRAVASAVKAASPLTPVIMLTGWGQRMVSDNDIPSNVDRVLGKPPKLRALREALAELTLRDHAPQV